LHGDGALRIRTDVVKMRQTGVTRVTFFLSSSFLLFLLAAHAHVSYIIWQAGRRAGVRTRVCREGQRRFVCA